MKRINNLISQSLAVGAAALLTATFPTNAAIISVNLTPFTGDAANIDSDETFGIVSEGTVVGGWLNFNRSGGDNTQGPLTTSSLPFSDGTLSTLGMTLTAPNSWANGFSGAYADTPLNQGLDDYPATVNPTSITLTNLNASFPNGYKVIVYVGGFNANRGASISDGTTTYYYRVDPAPVIPYGTFARTTQTTDLGATNNPIAQYAVFGDSVLLTSDTLTLTLDALYNGGAGLCGFQVVGASASELLARIWKGNLSPDWDTATQNWTNDFFGATNYADGDPVFFTDAAVAASPTVNLTGARSPGSVTVDSTKDYTFTGSGIAGATGLTKKGSGAIILSNPNTYTGNTLINEGTLRIGASGSLPDGAGAGDVSVATGATLDLNGNSEGINGLSGGGTLDNTGTAATLTVGLDNDATIFSGIIQGAVSLDKQGTNLITLSGSSFHTGTTIVGQGTLNLNPSSGFSSSGALVVSNGAQLSLSVTNGTGCSVAGVSLNGGVSLSIDYGNAAANGGAVPISTAGALDLNGVSQIAIKGTSFAVGSYTLISYGSKTGAGSISATPASLPTGMIATIQDTGSAIILNVTFPSIQTLAYTFGDGGTWATNSTADYWNLGTAVYTEYPGGLGDAVEFGTSYSGFPLLGGNISLGTDVHPYSIFASGGYTLNGPGKITGATGMQVAAGVNATFAVNTVNTFSGLTTVSSGTLRIGHATALGSTVGGTVVASGASLALDNGITLAGEPLTLNGNGTAANNGALRNVDTANPVSVSAPITLSSNARIANATTNTQLIITSPITDNGSNYTLFLTSGQTGSILRMNSANNVVGNVAIYTYRTNAGLMTFGVNNTFPSSTLTVGGGLFDLNGTSQLFSGLLAGSDPTFGVITNSSATASTLTINYSGTNSVQMQSALAGLINVMKQGGGVQSFAGGATVKHSYSGTTTINGGVFGIASDFSGVTNSFIVNSGGALRGSGNTIGGPVTINPGGTLYAGFAENSIGNLTINNSLSLAGNLIVALNKDVSPSNDVINVSGPLTYGGTLTITNLGTNALVVGDSFRIFPTGGTGSFTIVNPTGATFSFTDGLLTVTSVGSSQPTLGYAVLAGGVLQFSWSGNYVLQWQTNPLTTGLSNNWSDYPDASNPVNVTNNPAIPSAFFRLRSP